MTVLRERVEFEGAFGDRLMGRLERPSGEARAFVLFAHCFTCSKDLRGLRSLSRALVAEGFALLRFDFTGLGESEGEFADSNFSSNLDDLVAAADYLRRDHRAPAVLVGHSLGGAAVLAAAGRIPEVRAVATIGAPSDTRHLSATLLAGAPELRGAAEAEVTLAGRPFTIKRQLLDDLDQHRLTEAVSSLRRPLLIFHSPLDEVVDVDHAKRIYLAAKHPKSFVSLDRADHLLMADPLDAEYVGRMTACWASRVLGQSPALHAEHAEESLPHGRVVVSGGASGFATVVQAAGHLLPADEPQEVGGTDTGPAPYEYLLASLGACKVMTLRMYADRKRWPLEGTRIELQHSRIHAKDCEECESEEGMISRIDVSVELLGPLDGEQRDRLLEISERCPVHRTLIAEIDIQSELVAD